jgi:uncharacterized protein YigE (DUF2233 family)
MARLLIVITLLAVFGVFFIYRTGELEVVKMNPPDFDNQEELVTQSTATPFVTDQRSKSEEGGNVISYIVIRDLNDITFHSNLQERLNSEEIREKYSCRSLVNGGFYSKENTHIGLFIADKQKLSNSQTNPTFNGYLTINNQVQISRTANESVTHAVQTGPILISGSRANNFEIKNDDNKRRIVAAVLRDGNLVFIAVYDKSSKFLGPKLADLPGILMQFSDNTSIKIRDAINLDGGSASFFITDEVNLQELVRVGSFFCIK